jgi:16S rRNA (cytosine1402-N4)-methyltransferase
MHESVLLREVVEFLRPNREDGTLVDATAGAGGHSLALLERYPSARLLAIDRDPQALQLARERLERFADRVTFVQGRHEKLFDILKQSGIRTISGLLADLGVSSMQLDGDGRGFSFRRDEPLDMRMDQSRGETAADLLRTALEDDIANAIFQFGEERYSRRVARAIVNARRERPIETTGQLAAIVRRAVPHRGYQRIDPATRTFQGLRIWVNRELEGMDAFLATAAGRLLRGARLAVITFHSLEDRIVKHTFRALEKTGESLRVLTRRPVAPGDDEIDRNPRARSAKLRVIERFA